MAPQPSTNTKKEVCDLQMELETAHAVEEELMTDVEAKSETCLQLEARVQQLSAELEAQLCELQETENAAEQLEEERMRLVQRQDFLMGRMEDLRSGLGELGLYFKREGYSCEIVNELVLDLEQCCQIDGW